jgi:hypothetical protein
VRKRKAEKKDPLEIEELLKINNLLTLTGLSTTPLRGSSDE